jgi:hypothetical protein
MASKRWSSRNARMMCGVRDTMVVSAATTAVFEAVALGK